MIWGLMREYRALAPFFMWDVIIAVLWTVVSGIFGSMYLMENPEMDQGIADMKVAAWVDLGNLLLWILSASLCGWLVFVADRKVVPPKGKGKKEGEEEKGEAKGDGKTEGKKEGKAEGKAEGKS